MTHSTRSVWVALALATCVVWWANPIGAAPPTAAPAAAGKDSAKRDAVPPKAAPSTVEEARRQAKLLHEMAHATLHIVHLEYYREDEGLTIPAATIKRVFREMEERQNVKLRWLVVDGQAMNVDHVPQDDFEQKAVQALAAGKSSYELVGDKEYRHAAPIALVGDCLKCHLPNRTSTEPRTAGLLITIPTKAK